MVRMFDTIYRLWGKGRKIQGAVFPAAPICVCPLYRLAGGGAEGRRQEKNYGAFAQAASDLVKNYLDGLQRGRHPLLFYVRLPKYRRGIFGNSKDSIERSIQF